MGTGINPLQRFPQFIETSADAEAEAEAESEESEDSEDAAEGEESTETEVTHRDDAVADAEFDVDATNHVIPHRSTCVNCAYAA